MLLFSALMPSIKSYAEEKITGAFGYKLGNVIPVENLRKPPTKRQPYPTSSSATQIVGIGNNFYNNLEPIGYGFKPNKHFNQYNVFFSPKTRVIYSIDGRWLPEINYYDGTSKKISIPKELHESKVRTLVLYLENKYGNYEYENNGFQIFKWRSEDREIILNTDVSNFFIRIDYICNKSKAIYEKEKDEIEKEKDEIEKEKIEDNRPKLSDFEGL